MVLQALLLSVVLLLLYLLLVFFTRLDGEAVEAGLLLVLGLGILRQNPFPDGRKGHSVLVVQKVHRLQNEEQQNKTERFDLM